MVCGAIACVGKIAPLYNLAFSVIAFGLLIALISIKMNHNKVFIKPWYYLLSALSVFILEELITALKFFNIISESAIPRWFNAVFELIMVALFIYMLFVQINHVTEKYKQQTDELDRGRSQTRNLK
ncbi:hypothetical protein HN592_04695 [Candidatus Woesearchaeota archaeon]|jgi:hypothetical protein|nr:hypothetical protein [Candidatus Woesearchaeota archaeon]MBT4368511.1 hypothetical protein [Candidatus Woesearchaeota archaeon]MBT4713000.1 hypothetical protein [Candidatus Woesearchaeota archaeon]MBT6639912.1 hypothetical protein [Candidatus Woesearchaeota archaeon]MBT7134084.1 hypothetical protein [Candidatus Woesearchaeota archaeon]